MTDPTRLPPYESLAGMIDHAVLVPSLTPSDLEAGCRMARAYGCASACVMPYYVGRAAELLAGSKTLACCVIGFPHGNAPTAAKVAEASFAVDAGAKELDMVVNISLVKGAMWQAVQDDLAAVIGTGHDGGAKVKVIFETCYLTDDEKQRLCEVSAEAGADWVKTSTGFGTPPAGQSAGATDEDLQLMRKHSPESVQIKASGGIRDLDRLLRVRELGCSRAGASATKAILDEARQSLGLDPIQVAANNDGGTSY